MAFWRSVFALVFTSWVIVLTFYSTLLLVSLSSVLEAPIREEGKECRISSKMGRGRGGVVLVKFVGDESVFVVVDGKGF